MCEHLDCLQKVNIHKKNLVDLDLVFYDYTVNREEKCGSNGFSNHLHIFQPCGFSVSQLQFCYLLKKMQNQWNFSLKIIKIQAILMSNYDDK